MSEPQVITRNDVFTTTYEVWEPSSSNPNVADETKPIDLDGYDSVKLCVKQGNKVTRFDVTLEAAYAPQPTKLNRVVVDLTDAQTADLTVSSSGQRDTSFLEYTDGTRTTTDGKRRLRVIDEGVLV